MKKSQKNIRAFTLMEVVVTITVIGIIASFAVPNYTRALEKSKAAEGVELLKTLREAQLIYRVEKLSFSDNVAGLSITIPTPKNFNALTSSDINTSNPIAQVTRQGGLYTLRITDTGTITCTGSTMTCTQLGF